MSVVLPTSRQAYRNNKVAKANKKGKFSTSKLTHHPGSEQVSQKSKNNKRKRSQCWDDDNSESEYIPSIDSDADTLNDSSQDYIQRKQNKRQKVAERSTRNSQ